MTTESRQPIRCSGSGKFRFSRQSTDGEDFDQIGVKAEEYGKGEIRSSKMEKYKKRSGAADTAGQDYEVGMCVLLFLRGLRYCSDFRLASNHHHAGDFDDAVFMYKKRNQEYYNAVLVQMKHKRKSTISMRSLNSYKNDFSIRKYFKSFMASRDYWRNLNVSGEDRPLKEVSYVLYSNAAADSKLPGTEVVDPSFAHLLLTSGKCVRFRFDDIRDAFSEGSDVVDSALLSKQYEFLESFVLCHGQVGHDDLNTYIGEEIRHLVGCSDGDITSIKEKLKGGFKSWWAENESEAIYITKDFSIWRDILRTYVESFGEPYDSIKLRIDLRFSESCLGNVRSLIKKTKQLALLVENQHEARLACKKVQNAVGPDCLAVASDVFKSRAEEISNLNNQGAFSVLVVIELEGLSQMDDKCLRDIAGREVGSVVLICREVSNYWVTELGHTGFHDLDVTSANQLLEQVVNLQGAKFRLKDLTTDVTDITSRLNASHLIELSCDIVTMGQVLHDPIPYFVSRRLIRSNLLKKNFFSSLKRNEEMCVIIGERDILRHLRLRRGYSQEIYGATSTETYNENSNILFDEGKDNVGFHKTTLDNARGSVHWVKYNDGKFFWLKSRGDETTVKKHVIDEVISCLSDTDDTEIIINGRAGSGKTAWMDYVAANRKEYPTWVLKVDVTEKSLTESNFENAENIKNYLVQNCSSSGRRPGNLEDTLLRFSLDVLGNVIIFVDKLDMVNAKNSEKIYNFLSILPTVKHSKLVVATTPVEKDRTEEVLKTFAYDLDLFDEAEKRQFLLKFWKFKGVDYGIDETAKIDAILKNAGDCLSLPLTAYMTQMIFHNSMSPGAQVNMKLTPQLYTKLVEEELRNYLMAKLGVKDYSPSEGELFQHYKKSFFEDLMKLAATIFLKEEELNQRNFEKYPEDLHNSRFGLIGCKDGKPYFHHNSFAEYFFAMWLKSNDSDEKLLKENLFKSNADFVRQCFSSFYLENHDLHAAVADDDVERVKTLLLRKKDTDHAGRTALHVAAMNTAKYSREIAQLLIEAGVRVDAVDSLMKCNALQFALAASNWGVADVLLATEQFRGSKYARKLVGRFENYKAVFCQFCRLGYVELVGCMVKLHANLLTETYGDNHDSALHMAAESGSTKLVEWLLERDVKISENGDGLTPASVAAREGHVNILQVLSDKGVSLDQGETKRPIHLAALRNHVDVVNYLIGVFNDVGGSVEARDSSYETALHYASREGHLDLVRLLLIAGKADVNTVNGSQETPLHCAALHGHTAVVEILLDARANEEARNEFQQTPLHIAANRGKSDVVKLLVSRGADKNARDKKGCTPLHCAARYKHTSVLNTLISAGASVNAKDEDGATPLHYAAREDASKDDAYLLRRLWSGERVRPDATYQTACHDTVPSATRDVVEALLNAGADVNAVDNQQLKPATYTRHEAIRKMLQGEDPDDDLARFTITRLPGCRSGVII